MAQGKVVFDRVRRVELPQSRGDLPGHAPVGLLAAGEAEKAAKLFSEAEREHDLDKMRRVIKLLEDELKLSFRLHSSNWL